MASAIDPTKPEDEIPASKAELRANLTAAKTELDHGGFAEGFTPAQYGPPASARVRDHLAAIDTALGGLGSFTGLADTPAGYAAQGSRFVKVRADESGLEFASAPGGNGGLTGWTDVKADHGAVGDGASDDTTALQNALSSGASVIWLPEGTYRITNSISVTPGTTVLGAGPGRTIIDATGLADQTDPAAVVCLGTPTSLPMLAAPLSEGDKEVTFSSSVAAIVQQWDMIGLVDTRDGTFTSVTSDRQGVYVSAHAIDGSKVIFDTALQRALPSPRVAGGTAADVDAVVLDRRGVRMEGFRIDCRGLGKLATGSSTSGIGMTCRYLSDVWLENVVVQGAPTYGAEIDRCARAKVLGCRFTANDSGWTDGDGGYGFGVYGCAYVHAWGCYFAGYRKGLDVGKGGGENPIRQLSTHDCIFDNVICQGMAENDFVAPGSALTTSGGCHPGCFNLRFSNSVFHGTFTLRGFGQAIVNSFLIAKNDGNNPALITGDLGPRFGNIIQGNRFLLLNSNVAILYTVDEHSDTEPAGVLDISNNVFEIQSSTTSPVIRINGAVKAGKAHLKIHNNVVLSSNAQDFVEISSTDGNYVYGSILDNQLGGLMSLGTVANADAWVARNVIGVHLQFDNLPSSNPGGSGRLWNDGGTLKIT